MFTVTPYQMSHVSLMYNEANIVTKESPNV